MTAIDAEVMAWASERDADEVAELFIGAGVPAGTVIPAREVARNVQPFQVEPAKFGYRLVRGELTFAGPGTIEAHCRIDQGPTTVVPLTLLPPA